MFVQFASELDHIDILHSARILKGIQAECPRVGIALDRTKHEQETQRQQQNNRSEQHERPRQHRRLAVNHNVSLFLTSQHLNNNLREIILAFFPTNSRSIHLCHHLLHLQMHQHIKLFRNR